MEWCSSTPSQDNKHRLLKKKKKRAVTAGETYMEGRNGKIRVQTRTAGTISRNIKDG